MTLFTPSSQSAWLYSQEAAAGYNATYEDDDDDDDRKITVVIMTVAEVVVMMRSG